MKIVTGMYTRPIPGKIFVERPGRSSISAPAERRPDGNRDDLPRPRPPLPDSRNVAANIFLGREPVKVDLGH